MTVGHLDQIANAFRAARAYYSPMSAELAADILAGDESALERGQQLRAGIAWLTAQLEAILGDSRYDIDPLAITEALGLLAMDEAIEVASGETEHPDPAINARFAAAREARMRAV